MTNQQIPAEYAWIKPGVVVAHPRHKNVTYTFATEPFISQSFWDRDVWVAENERGTEMVLDAGWVQIETAEQTLAKARAVLTEQSVSLVEKIKKGSGHFSSSEVAIGFATFCQLVVALEGGGDE